MYKRQIKLNAENVSQSVVMFNSRQNENLDWDTIDRLAENPDFDQFIGDIMTRRKDPMELYCSLILDFGISCTG